MFADESMCGCKPAVETKPAKEEVAPKAAKEEPAKSPRKPGFGAYRGGAHTGGKEPRLRIHCYRIYHSSRPAPYLLYGILLTIVA